MNATPPTAAAARPRQPRAGRQRIRCKIDLDPAAVALLQRSLASRKANGVTAFRRWQQLARTWAEIGLLERIRQELDRERVSRRPAGGSDHA